MSVRNALWTFRTLFTLQKYWKFITCGSTRQISVHNYKFRVAKGTEVTQGVTTYTDVEHSCFAFGVQMAQTSSREPAMQPEFFVVFLSLYTKIAQYCLIMGQE